MIKLYYKDVQYKELKKKLMGEQNAAIASNPPCKLTPQTCRRVHGGSFLKVTAAALFAVLCSHCMWRT